MWWTKIKQMEIPLLNCTFAYQNALYIFNPNMQIQFVHFISSSWNEFKQAPIGIIRHVVGSRNRLFTKQGTLGKAEKVGARLSCHWGPFLICWSWSLLFQSGAGFLSFWHPSHTCRGGLSWCDIWYIWNRIAWRFQLLSPVLQICGCTHDAWCMMHCMRHVHLSVGFVSPTL